MALEPEALRTTMMDCLFRQGEIPIDGSPPEGVVFVEGLTAKFGLHPDRLESHRAEVGAMLAEMPDGLKDGMTFLQLCEDREGRQWTSYHRDVELLVVLGVGLKLLEYCAPRALWAALPGGMPYVQLVSSQAQPVVSKGRAHQVEDEGEGSEDRSE